MQIARGLQETRLNRPSLFERSQAVLRRSRRKDREIENLSGLTHCRGSEFGSARESFAGIVESPPQALILSADGLILRQKWQIARDGYGIEGGRFVKATSQEVHGAHECQQFAGCFSGGRFGILSAMSGNFEPGRFEPE